MCCIFGFIKWSISCIHRSLTFILGFWVVATILYALALAIASGVAFGYNYCLAEYKTLARSEVQFTLKSRQYVPEVLKRRSGDVAGIMALGDEYQPSSRSDGHVDETYLFTPPSPPSLWMYEYEPSQIKQSIRRVPPITHTTEIVKMYYRMTKTREIVTNEEKPHTEADMSLPEIGKEAYNAVDMSLPKIEKEEYSVEDTSLPKIVKTKLSKESIKSAPTTVATSKATPSPSLSTTSKSESTSSKPKPKPQVTESETADNTWPSHVIRVFVPKSTNFKWRPTKPSKQFFYRTLPTGHRKIAIGDSYQPEMEIRTYNRPSYGKYEGAMRHWDATTKPPEPPETSVEDNIYKNMLYF